MKRQMHQVARISFSALGICSIAAIAAMAVAQSAAPTSAPAVNQRGPTIKEAYAKTFLIGTAGDIPGNF